MIGGVHTDMRQKAMSRSALSVMRYMQTFQHSIANKQEPEDIWPAKNDKKQNMVQARLKCSDWLRSGFPFDARVPNPQSKDPSQSRGGRIQASLVASCMALSRIRGSNGLDSIDVLMWRMRMSMADISIYIIYVYIYKYIYTHRIHLLCGDAMRII